MFQNILQADISPLLAWWGRELLMLLPASWQHLWFVRRAVVVLRPVDQHQVEVSYRLGERVEPLGIMSLDEQGASRWQQLIQQRPDLGFARMLLTLQPGQFVIRQFRLPLAAQENLMTVLGFELDRLTPFTQSQAYYSGRLLEVLKASGQIRVELVALPRYRLDPLLEQMQSIGWLPSRVDVLDYIDSRSHQLLPPQYQVKGARLPGMLAIVAGLASLVALLCILFIPLGNDYERMDRLKSELRRVSKEAKEVDELRKEAENLTHQMNFLAEKKSREPSMLDMLNELSRALPDDTWLNGMQYKDGRVVVQGQSPAASNLIAKIESSAYFKATSFLSPVTKDLSNGLERFQISSEVVNGRLSESRHQELGPEAK